MVRKEGIDAAQQKLLLTREGVDGTEHTRPFAADQLTQAQLRFHTGGDGDVGAGMVAAQGLHIGEGVFLCGLAHRQGLLGEGGELIAMPVVEELMQQQRPLGALAPVGEGGVCWEAQAPAAVEQILQFALQALGSDAGIELIGCQPKPGQFSIFGRAAHATELLAEQGLELAESTIAGLLQGDGDVAVGEIGPFEQLLHLVGLHHLAQVDAGAIGQLDVEAATGANQLQQDAAPLGFLTTRQVDEPGVGQILGHQRFNLATQLIEARSGHHPLRLLLTQVQAAGFTATGLGRGDVVEKGAQLLAQVKDQQHPMLAELPGQFLAEAAVELVGGQAVLWHV